MILLMVRAQRPHSALHPRQPYTCFAERGMSAAALIAQRTSSSLKTLQEQTIKTATSLRCSTFDIEAQDAMQKEKDQFEDIPNWLG
jgi:hypothetical protein